MTDGNLCHSCTNSIWCATWCEWKCTKHAVRFTSYGHSQPTSCLDYKRRDKNFKGTKCQCKDCLINEKLLDDLNKEGD